MQMLTDKRTSSLVRGALLLTSVLALSACSVLGGGKDKGPKTPVVGQRTSILNSDRGVEVDPTLAGVPVALPESYVNADWPQPGGNSAKMIGHVALARTPGPIWESKIKGSSAKARLAASPVVKDGKLFVIDSEAHVIAMNALTGARLWVTPIAGGRSAKSLFGGGVSVDGDRVFVTTGVGDVVALNAATGAFIWKKRMSGPLRGSPTVANGNVFVMSQDNQIYALNQSDGETQWSESGTVETTGVFGVSAPAVAQGTVVAGFSSGELSAYRYENGRNLWGDALARTTISTSVAALADIDADPVIDRGRVFAIGQGGRMASYELVSGQRLWEINVGGISTPAVVGEWVFVVTNEAKLLCVSRTTGKIRWIEQLPRWQSAKKRKGAIRWTGPVLAGGRLILVSTAGDLAAVDPDDGKLMGRVDMNHPMSLRPIVANNILYVLTDDGNIAAMR
jgi:outer membrane protein assembly factor BamB